VLERSRFATETGAAMHMAPNATALLEWMDVRPSEVGGTLLRQVCFATMMEALSADYHRCVDLTQVAICCIQKSLVPKIEVIGKPLVAFLSTQLQITDDIRNGILCTVWIFTISSSLKLCQHREMVFRLRFIWLAKSWISIFTMLV
jgi:hypothetical protein